VSALGLAGVAGIIETLAAVIARQSFEQSGNPPSARAGDPRPRAAQMAPRPRDPDLLGVWSVVPFTSTKYREARILDTRGQRSTGAKDTQLFASNLL
jgi:hypothetical protein